MRHFRFQVVMVLGALLCASVHAAPINETFKLTASDADFFDEFGWSVAVTALCVSTRRRSCCPSSYVRAEMLRATSQQKRRRRS